jgi:ATP adenylyltransferase
VERLWAPWRLEYIAEEKRPGCVFCNAAGEGDDAQSLILHRGASCFVILNRFPYNNGHLMVVPYTHERDLEALDESTLLELLTLARRAASIMGRLMRAEGFNLGLNVGRTAGAGIDEHLHLHVVPRWNGDTNYMPVLGDTKIIPQSLQACYELLAPAFREEAAR